MKLDTKKEEKFNEKIFTFISLLLLTFVVGGLIVQALPAPGEGEATVVVHFHKWDENYENVGGHAWKEMY